MSLTIKTNTSSLIAQNSLKTSTSKLNQAIERMSSGAKINHAKDNAANYSIATNMTTKINALQVAEDNVNMGLDMVGTALETLASLSDYTNRLRGLAMQAQNGTYGDKSIDALNTEAISLINEIYRTKNTAEYNGISLFGGLEQVSNITFPDGTTEKKYEFINKVTHRDTSTMTSISELDETVTTTGGTYSVSSVEEIEKAFSMIKAGTLTSAELVLANDVDYSDFTGTHTQATVNFDGNGYVISNFKSNSFFTGFYSKVKNLGLENLYISGSSDNLSTFGNSTVSNCYVTGVVKGRNNVGGLVGNLKGRSIKDSYFVGEVSGGHSVGGIAGYVDGNENNTIENCYSVGTIKGTDHSIGGLVGSCYNRSDRTLIIRNCCSTAYVSGNEKESNGGLIGSLSIAGTKSIIENCYSAGKVNSSTGGGLIGAFTSSIELTNCYYNTESSGRNDTGKGVGLTSSQLNRMVAQGQLPDYGLDLPVTGINDESSNRLYSPAFVEFQVGISAEDSAGIYIDLTFTIDGLKDLCYWGLSSDSSLESIDRMVKSIADKESELGALQNRFESALDAIVISYDNLVSSRSTIMDADMAEVSSEYIRQQILQEASATLMATANQSPSIALQLI